MYSVTQKVLIAVALVVMTATGSSQDLIVYDESLASGWQNWSWGTNVNLSSTSASHSGSNSISAEHTGAWGALYLRSQSTLAVTDYDELTFWIHGGATGSQDIQVFLVDGSGTASPSNYVVPALTAGTWRQESVSTSTFGSFTGLHGILFQDRSGSAQSVYYVDDIVLTDAPSSPPESFTLSVDITQDNLAIDPNVYGMNFADEALAVELDLPVNRWRGNSTTRYHWEISASHKGSDWYFVTNGDTVADVSALPDGSASDVFVQANFDRGTDSIVTLPLIEWTPIDRTKRWSFSVAKYGAQDEVEPFEADAGNGVSGGVNIVGNDPTDTCKAIDVTFVTDWLTHLHGNFGTAGTGGVRFYAMDNEPMLWKSTHRDVHPVGTSYDEIRDRTYTYAAAVKATDPNALILGPISWGWISYFYSGLDTDDGGSWWNTRSDRMAHGDTPFIEWYLQQMADYETTNGTRILDYLTVHFYPQNGEGLTTAGDSTLQATRLRSTRSLWDPTYVDESWINDTVRLIPRMKEWVANNYPGTKLAITEYNWGGHEHINGALAQADILGIFGREGVDLATIWGPPTVSQPAAYSFRMYRNYDGSGSKFGDVSVRTVTSDHTKLSAYAATRSGDDMLTVLVVNKTYGIADTDITIPNVDPAATVEVFEYSTGNLSAIVQQPNETLSSGTLNYNFPAQSITMLVLKAD